jgi:excisionase family DNA binding protein
MSRESNENDDHLLLLEEVAEITRLSASTLRWLRHRGEGPPGFKMGRRVMFRRTAVLEWIREHEQAQQ